MKKRSRKNENVKPFERENLVENYNILTEVKNKHVKALKQEMESVRKRLREDSLSEIETEMIKKKISERVLEEEKYTEQDERVIVNKNKLLSVIKSLKRKRNVEPKLCNRSDCAELSWDSPTVVIRQIRSCVLNHDWNQLTHLLLLMLHYNRRYLPYVKMMSFLDFLVNPADLNGDIFEEFIQKCFFQVPPNFRQHILDICLSE